MGWFLLGLLVVGVVVLVVGFSIFGRKRRAQELADAREEALRWYERLGGQIMNLSGDDNPAVKQSLVDAGERYNAAGAQLDRATTPRQYALARETALEGLAYVRAARTAMGLDPGPDLPPLAGQQAAGAITKERDVDVQGQHYRASPQPASDTPYYYPGGVISGRPVPAGWYSQPWWKTALIGGAWGLGTVLVFDALFSPAWGDPGYGWGGGGWGGDWGGGDYVDGGGDYDASGDVDGGDFDGGGFGDGDFDGGGFGGGDGGGDFF